MRRGLMIVVTTVAVVAWCAGAASATTTWAIQATPNPAGSTYSQLAGVSCSSPTSCTAVGKYYSNGSALTLAEHWDGSTWAIQATPNPAGSTFSQLAGVSCSSPTSCTAVGSYDSSGIELTLAEHWDGSTWAIQATPSPAGSSLSELAGVSCVSATRCTAVGWWCVGNCGKPDRPLAEHWNGTKWVRQSIPSPADSVGAGTNLEGVSCHLATSCVAAGWYESSSAGMVVPLAEQWNGSAWAIQSIPSPAGAKFSQLFGVSCRLATSCTAVGEYQTVPGTALTLAEHWDGSTWAVQATPNRVSAPWSQLQGVSCASVNLCTAVGWSQTSHSGKRPLAERWNGSAWAIQATPSPVGSYVRPLEGVSCAVSSSCTAVGYHYGRSGPILTLAEAT